MQESIQLTLLKYFKIREEGRFFSVYIDIDKMKFKNCLVWAIKAKYFHTVLKLINVERLFQNNGIEFVTAYIALPNLN